MKYRELVGDTKQIILECISDGRYRKEDSGPFSDVQKLAKFFFLYTRKNGKVHFHPVRTRSYF